jgi:hypothetical protein
MCDYALVAKECASVVMLLSGVKLDGVQYEELSFFTVAEPYCLAMARVSAARRRLSELEDQLKQEETAATSLTQVESLESVVEDAREELSLAELMAEGRPRTQTECALRRWLMLVFYDSFKQGCCHVEEAESALPSYRDSVAAINESSGAEDELGKLAAIREQLVEVLARALRASTHAVRLMAERFGDFYRDFSVILIDIFEQVLALIKDEEDNPPRGNIFGMT